MTKFFHKLGVVKAPLSIAHSHRNNQNFAVVIYKIDCQMQSCVSPVNNNEFVDRVLNLSYTVLYHLEQMVRLK